MVNDPVADLLNQIKNAVAVGKTEISVPYSIMKHGIADILKDRGFIAGVEKKGKKVRKTLVISLNPERNEFNVARLSKPSRRVYFKAKDIKPVRSGKGILILSTPAGILDGEKARADKLGGEALCKVW